MSQPGEPIPPPIVAEHEQKKFDKMVNYYFPGNEAFVKTEGVLRPLGALKPKHKKGQFVFERVDNSVDGNGKFDQSGVIHHIATEGGASDWVNPHTAGRVAVEWSSVQSGPVENFVSKFDAKCGGSYTNNHANSWMRVDLGEARALAVTHYALRNDGNNNYALRNWELQGAEAADGPWTTLRRHENDQAISTRTRFVAAWPVDGAAPFRFFRVYQYGKNNAGDNLLMCSGIELYGTLTEA
eukprot:COSAG06_NODE_778_length_12377_cov_54.670875_3_plen_240_part_00